MQGLRVVSMAVNLPGPLTAARYVELGAHVTKVVPPGGDPLAWVSPQWHDNLKEDQEVLTLDLKSNDDQARLAELLRHADLLLTATRPAALERLGLGWERLAAQYPRLCHLAIVGYGPPDENRAGHDLTYQASAGILELPDGLREQPAFPRIPLADYAGAERAVCASLALLWERERTGRGARAVVSLVEALTPYSHALCYGLLAPGTLLGGASPLYGLYRSSDGWVALAALEPHFQDRIRRALGLEQLTAAALADAFGARTSAEWDKWASEIDVPLAAVREAVCPG
jgi:crotonobetainyl-CoA:carnitine CoA-transferase CaiB-like acyl-CoA transferase